MHYKVLNKYGQVKWNINLYLITGLYYASQAKMAVENDRKKLKFLNIFKSTSS